MSTITLVVHTATLVLVLSQCSLMSRHQLGLHALGQLDLLFGRGQMRLARRRDHLL